MEYSTTNIDLIIDLLKYSDAFIISKRLVIDERFVLELLGERDNLDENIALAVKEKDIKRIVKILDDDLQKFFACQKDDSDVYSIPLVDIGEKHHFVQHQGMLKRKDDDGFFFVKLESNETIAEDRSYIVSYYLYFGQVLNESGIDYEDFDLSNIDYKKGYFAFYSLPVEKGLELPFLIFDDAPELKDYIKKYKKENAPSLKTIIISGSIWAGLFGLIYGLTDPVYFTQWWYYLIVACGGLLFGWLMSKTNNRFPYVFNTTQQRRLAQRIKNIHEGETK